jgi:hypothetical protein
MIKKTIPASFLLMLLFTYFGWTQEQNIPIKTGFSLGAIPAFAFDSDLGLKYGAVLNLFDYGNGDRFPDYKQHLFLRFTNTTRGSAQFQAILESEKIISKSKSIIEVSYLSDKKLEFFGFDGRNAVFHPNNIDPKHTDVVNSAFYAHHRNWLRLRFDIQKFLIGRELRLLAGISYNHIRTGPEEISNIESNIPNRSLYENYIQWGIIGKQEASGGDLGYLTLGLIYDTRNEQSNCTDGRWLETFLVISPGIFDTPGFSKLIFTYRHYHSFFQNRLTLTGRASIQNKLSGKIPFYFLPVYMDSRQNQDGIGGAFNLRGVSRNRLAANGYLTGNFEIRQRLGEFSLLKQHFTLSGVVFYDMAYITQPVKPELSQVPETQKARFFRQDNQKPHHSAGPGLFIIFNRNNVVSVNYGIPFSFQDGIGGLYIGSSLLF